MGGRVGERTPKEPVGWVRWSVGSYRILEKRYLRPVQPNARVNEWVQGHSSRAVLPFTTTSAVKVN